MNCDRFRCANTSEIEGWSSFICSGVSRLIMYRSVLDDGSFGQSSIGVSSNLAPVPV